MKYGQISNCGFQGMAQQSAAAVSILPSGDRGVVLSVPFEVHRQYRPIAPPINSLSGFWPSSGKPIQQLHEERWGNLSSSHLDDVSFMYAMTYYDRVVFALPAHPMMGHVAAELSELQKKFVDIRGFEIMPLYPEGPVGSISDMSDGSVMFDPPSLQAFQFGIKMAFQNLLERDGVGWEIGNGSTVFLRLIFPVKDRELCFACLDSFL